MKINIFSVKFDDRSEIEPTTIEVDAAEDVKTAIDKFFMKNYGAVPTYCWSPTVYCGTSDNGDEDTDDNDNNLDDLYPSVDDFAEEIRHLLRRYFECDDNKDPNAEYDPDYSAQDCIDDIRELVGNI